MALPSIVMPGALPAWAASGQALTLGWPYAAVPVATGAPRRRRVLTVAEHSGAGEMLLTAAEAAIFCAWYEYTLQAGSQRFAAPLIGTGAARQWWDAAFAAPPQWRSRRRDGGAVAWQLSASLHLRGEPETEAPE